MLLAEYKHMTTGRINQIDIQLTLSLPTLTRPKHNAIGRNIFHSTNKGLSLLVKNEPIQLNTLKTSTAS